MYKYVQISGHQTLVNADFELSFQSLSLRDQINKYLIPISAVFLYKLYSRYGGRDYVLPKDHGSPLGV